MPLTKFTDDPIVKRLRWVMIGAMLFSLINTLSGQPNSFWQHPETAIRGDGLSIFNKTNHTFDFFLGHGWQAYIVASLVYLAGAFLIVSVLPRLAALITIFSFIFTHFYDGSNWLAVRWQLGMQGPIFYIAIAVIVVFSAFPAPEIAAPIVIRLRWVMLGAMLLDFVNTLVGQPDSYWRHPETVHEGNALSRFFLAHGWMAFSFYDVFYLGGAFLLVSILPRRAALVCTFAFIFGGFGGGSNWFFYEWRMGWETPIIYGLILSAIIVFLAFSPSRKPTAF
jgi:hypothetical protein